jgi:hypothetical protein
MFVRNYRLADTYANWREEVAGGEFIPVSRIVDLSIRSNDGKGETVVTFDSDGLNRGATEPRLIG